MPNSLNFSSCEDMVAELFAALIEMISSHLKTLYKQTYQTGA